MGDTLDRVFVNLYDQTDANNPDEVEVIEFGPDDYVIHPDYIPQTDENNPENDIALILLPHEVENADTIQYPQLNEENDEPEGGDPLLVMGWGDTLENGDGSFSDVLLQAGVNYVTNQQCTSDYDYDPLEITDDMMCAAAAGRDSCVGDSGGPLILNNGNRDPVLVGVVSFGPENCADPDYPGVGVYARVSHFAEIGLKRRHVMKLASFAPNHPLSPQLNQVSRRQLNHLNRHPPSHRASQATLL